MPDRGGNPASGDASGLGRLIAGFRKTPYLTAAFVLLLLYPPLQVFIRQIAPTYSWVIAALFMAHMFTGNLVARTERHLAGWPMFDRGLVIAIVGLMVFGAFMTPDRSVGFGHLAQVIGAALTCWFVAYGTRWLPKPQSIWPLVLSVAVASVLLLLTIRFWPQAHLMIGKRDYITDTNRVAVLLALLCPFLLFHVWRGAGAMRLVALATTGLAVWSIFGSFSESAKLALLVAVLAFGLALVNSRLTVWLVAGATLAYIAVAPWISVAGPSLVPRAVVGMTEASTGQVRIDMWHEFGLLVLQKPLLGWGLETSRFAADLKEVIDLPEARRKLLGLWHVHNAVLQVWFELGAIGALLLGAAIWRISLRLLALPDVDRMIGVSLFAAVIAVSCVSHGAWQVWWYCMVALATCFRPIALVFTPPGERARRDGQTNQPATAI